MKKIFNWTVGSFFRTIGRTIAFLLFGALLFYICQKSGLKITDLLGIGRVYADTTYNWSTKQSKIYYDNQGTEASYNWQNVPYTHSANYPITKLEYRLSYSQGLSAGNIYTFTLYFTPSPDAINVSGLSFHDLTGDITNVNCSGWSRNSNGRYQNTCAIGLDRDISSSSYLYAMITFNAGYLNSLRSDISSFSITKGVGAVVQDSAIDIMNNNNNNTQQIIDSTRVCSNISKSNVYENGYTLDASGNKVTGNNERGITNYINVKNSELSLISKTTMIGAYMCFYDNNKNLISCSATRDMSLGLINKPSNTEYIRATIFIPEDKPTFKLCQNGSQATTNAINDINDTINDDDTSSASNQASNFFSSFTTNDHGLTGIITAPLSAIQSLTSSTCRPLVLPLPFVNQNLTLPCMRDIYVTHFGQFITLYDTITLGIISYWVMVRVFALVKDFKNPDHDEIEVMEL